MAAHSKNKYPADKAGTKYSEFKNTRRTAPGKKHSDKQNKQAGTEQTTGKTG
jgi:hypothetical protein